MSIQTSFVPMKPRTQELFQLLLESCDYVTTHSLAERYGVTVRTIRYDLEELESICRSLPVEVIRNRFGVYLDTTLEDREQLLHSLRVPDMHVKSCDTPTRLFHLLSVLLSAREPVVVKQLQDILQVSPRTIYADMDRAESWLHTQGLQLIRKPHYGMKVEGSELFRRYACFLIVHHVLSDLFDERLNETSTTIRLHSKSEFGIERIVDRLINPSEFEKLHSIVHSFAKDVSLRKQWELIIYLSIMLQRSAAFEPVVLARQNIKLLQDLWEYEEAARLLARVNQEFPFTITEEEISCVALHYLGVWRVSYEPSGNPGLDREDRLIHQIVANMLMMVDQTLGVDLKLDDELFKGLLLHVKPMVYRVLFGIPLQNDLLDDIQTNYILAYHAAIIAGQCIETTLAKSVSSAELGFLALHFGAALERRPEKSNEEQGLVYVAVLCPSGVGTSKLLASQLEKKVSKAVVHLQLNSDQALLLKADANIDGIVSTVALKSSSVPVIVVNPLVSVQDLERLDGWIERLLLSKRKTALIKDLTIYTQQLFAQHHVSIASHDVIVSVVADMVQRVLVSEDLSSSKEAPTFRSRPTNTSEEGGHALLDLLVENAISVQYPAQNREEVIQEAGELLIKQGAVEPRYVEAMQRSIVENGPYMVIVPRVAILHARPEDGVNQISMSLVTLQEGISFGHKDNDPVYLVIAFGAVDHDRHIEALSDLMRLLSDKQAVTDLVKADCVQQVMQILHRVLEVRDGEKGGDTI